MFSKIKSLIKCYLCGDSHTKMTTCVSCKKIVCYDCKSCAFVGGGRTCFWCLKKRHE